MAVPSLRFKEYSDKWPKVSIGEIAKTFSGGTPKSTNSDFYNGDIPFIKSGEIGAKQVAQSISEQAYNSSSAKMVVKGDLLYALYGATSGEVAISQIQGAINQAVLCLRTDSDVRFLKLFLELRKERILSTYLQGGQGNLSAEIVKSIKLNLPSLPEQRKIADFLSAVDEKIRLLTEKKAKLETYKKGVMQKLFPTPGQTNPELRFKRPDGSSFPDWEEKRLGEVSLKKSSNISANNLEENEGIYVIYGASGVLKTVDFYDEENPYISIVKDGAGVGRTFLCKEKTSVLGTLDKILAIENVSLGFLFYRLSLVRFVKYITGSTIPHIYYRDYKNEKLMVPSFEEQLVISSFLSDLDLKLNTMKDEIDQMKDFKKGLLQQMFV